MVAALAGQAPQSTVFGTHDDAERTPVVDFGVGYALARFDAAGEPNALLSQPHQAPRQVPHFDDEKVLQSAAGGLRDRARQRCRAAFRNKHRICAGGLGGAQTSAQVARIFNAVEYYDQGFFELAPTRLKILFRCRRKGAPFGRDTLVVAPVGNPRQRRRWNSFDADAFFFGERTQCFDLVVASAGGNDDAPDMVGFRVQHRANPVDAEHPIRWRLAHRRRRCRR